MNIEFSKQLHDYNSFGFDISAEFFVSVRTTTDLKEALEWSRNKNIPSFILGGGSNTVFTRNVVGLVIHIAIDGYSEHALADKNYANLKVGAGVNWHQLVIKTLQNKLYGLEHLALIPGCAGAAPIQNIGAYGSEIKDALISVDVLDKTSGELSVLNNSDCHFDYRHSIFKTPAGNDFVVTAINLKLSRLDQPQIKYKALQDALDQRAIENAGSQQIFDSVCEIRRAKLPDPDKLGNAGSFFKNPVISRQLLDTLLQTHKKLPHFEQSDGYFKVPAAWLIDRAGWKGHRKGSVGVHSEQALVLVNLGGGNGQQIAILAEQIRNDIQNQFGIALEREPVLY